MFHYSIKHIQPLNTQSEEVYTKPDYNHSKILPIMCLVSTKDLTGQMNKSKVNCLLFSFENTSANPRNGEKLEATEWC